MIFWSSSVIKPSVRELQARPFNVNHLWQLPCPDPLNLLSSTILLRRLVGSRPIFYMSAFSEGQLDTQDILPFGNSENRDPSDSFDD
jgi:hypothetical protein